MNFYKVIKELETESIQRKQEIEEAGEDPAWEDGYQRALIDVESQIDASEIITLKNLLDKLENESKEREKDELYGYEELSMEAGIQSTIKEIRSWLEKNTFSWKISDHEHINLVRV